MSAKMSKEWRVFGVVVLSLIMAMLLVKAGFMALEEAAPPTSYLFSALVFVVAAAVLIVPIQKALREGSWTKSDKMTKLGRWFLGA